MRIAYHLRHRAAGPRLRHPARRGQQPTIALPALGCGLGGLDWETVRIAVETAFRKKPTIRVSLYSPK